MLLAGPLADKTGSLIVIEADSLEHANRIAQEDPYTVNGVFQRGKSIPSSRSSPQTPRWPSPHYPRTFLLVRMTPGSSLAWCWTGGSVANRQE